MRYFLLALLVTACRPPAAMPPPASPGGEETLSPSAAVLGALHDDYRVDAINKRKFTYRKLWSTLGPTVDAAPHVRREQIGESAEGRPIYLLGFGSGPEKVLLWSQMHGDESTATMALADLFRYLAEAPDDPRVQALSERVTVAAIPMLNPDGAERFQRRNAYGIDVNRDARALLTPEGRALKRAHERFEPHFGFNLHDQNVRTRVGDSERLAAIALLAPPADEAGTDDEARVRAKQIAAVVKKAVEPLVGGHIARYDDTYNPRAFGDRMQSWGTSTVLIESGGWRDDPEKQHLRRTNFVGILSALEAIADGTYALADPAAYESLPENGRPVRDLLIRGGTVVLPGLQPIRADVAVDYGDPLAQRGGTIEDVGDLADVSARDTLDATGLFLHPARETQIGTELGNGLLSVGEPASFVLRRGPDPESEAVWVMRDGELPRQRDP